MSKLNKTIPRNQQPTLDPERVKQMAERKRAQDEAEQFQRVKEAFVQQALDTFDRTTTSLLGSVFSSDELVGVLMHESRRDLKRIMEENAIKPEQKEPLLSDLFAHKSATFVVSVGQIIAMYREKARRETIKGFDAATQPVKVDYEPDGAKQA